MIALSFPHAYREVLETKTNFHARDTYRWSVLQTTAILISREEVTFLEEKIFSLVRCGTKPYLLL